MRLFLYSLLFLSDVIAQSDLVGTWSTKSKKVMTGPGFYDPVHDKFIEPELTGISYSFTADGHYEEAYYRAGANPSNPQCPTGIMQWQHGTYKKEANGTVILTPIAVDGRQLLSNPCTYDNSIYTRYGQQEIIKHYSAYLDTYHNVQRLDLFKFDGSPMNPMFLAFNPPQMLPTQTLNPTTTGGASAKPTSKSRVKRDPEPGHPTRSKILIPINFESYDRVWWLGVLLIGVGSMMYMWPEHK